MSNEYHNRLRKARVLSRCINLLEELQIRYNPIFWEDEMICRYLEQMRADVEQLMTIEGENDGEVR